MINTTDIEKLFPTDLRNVYVCLKEGPSTIDRIISVACTKGISFSHPKKDVRRSLIVLEIMGLTKKTFSGSAHIFRLSGESCVRHENLHEISKGIALVLDKLDSDWIKIDIENLRTSVGGISDDNFRHILDLFAKKKRIRIENGKVIKNVTTY